MEEILNDYAEDKDNFKKTANIKSELKYGSEPVSNLDLTIVIPTYHRVDGVRKALNSIFKQDANGIRFRVIIIDNDQFELAGSETEKILKKYPEDKISYYQNEQNIGMVGNWNRCIELPKTKWIAMLHDDDILSKRYFALIKPILKRVDNSDIVYVRATSGFLNEDGRPEERNGLTKRFHQRFANKLMIFNGRSYDYFGPQSIGAMGTPSCGTLINREIFLRYGGYDDSHYPSFDAYFPERLATQHGYKVAITTGFMGYSYDRQSASTKEKTIMAWSKEYANYSKNYYAKRSKLSSCLYNLFSEEMGLAYRDDMTNYINISTNFTNKEEVKSNISKILNYKDRGFRRRLYKIFYMIYFRNKQLQALIVG